MDITARHVNVTKSYLPFDCFAGDGVLCSFKKKLFKLFLCVLFLLYKQNYFDVRRELYKSLWVFTWSFQINQTKNSILSKCQIRPCCIHMRCYHHYSNRIRKLTRTVFSMVIQHHGVTIGRFRYTFSTTYADRSCADVISSCVAFISATCYPSILYVRNQSTRTV